MREHRVLGHEKDEAPTGATAVLVGRQPYGARVQLRYAYRLSPTAGQRQALARAFGCARVVFNDAVAARRDNVVVNAVRAPRAGAATTLKPRHTDGTARNP